MIQPRNATTADCCPATLPNLLDTSSRDQENQIKTLPNTETKLNSRISHFRKARDVLTAQNSILPLIVLIMLCSVVNGDPPTALTSGLLNTAATGDTTMAGSNKVDGSISQTMTGMPQTIYFGMSRLDANVVDNIKIFKYDLSLACKATWSVTDARALVIKGPGKVFAGSWFTADK